MLFYFVFVALLTCAIHYSFYRRLVVASALPPFWVRFFRALLSANALLLPAALVVSLRAHPASAGWAVPLARAAVLDEALCILALSALAARELLFAMGRLAMRPFARDAGPSDPERRHALLTLRASGLTVAGLAVGATGVAHAQALALPEVRRVALPIPRLHPALAGFRIAQITDLHVGPTLRGDTVAALVAQVNALAPDVIVVTGDLVDGSVSQLASEVAPLKDLRATYGCFFVTGNHEYYSGAVAWLDHVRGFGWNTLVNAHAIIERGGARLLIAGICDESGARYVPEHRQDLTAALAGAPPVDARLLLAHRPDGAKRAAARGFDAQLSGHVHGGQFFPWSALLRAALPYFAGLYDVAGMHLYVSRGCGYWGPSIRLDAPQELALFELTRAPDTSA